MKRTRFALLVPATAVCLVSSFQFASVHAASASAQATAQNVGAKQTAAGAKVYAADCAICHGDHRQGHPPTFPALIGIEKKLTAEQISVQIHKGKGAMPPRPDIKGDELAALLSYLAGTDSQAARTAPMNAKQPQLTGPTKAGDALFQQNCAFCHGRDAMGGESGPDLTRSKLVLADNGGDKIFAVIREGRPGTKMPPFNFTPQQLESLDAFIHFQVANAALHQGGRRGVDVADLQTGNVEAGKKYFYGEGGCAKCHSPTGDLAGVADRYQGLDLEERMLYPRNVKSTVTVTLPTGEKVTGTLAYHDEFTVALRDSEGNYRSWQTDKVQYMIDAPVEAHVRLFDKYTDDDIHNLMAYLQTLRSNKAGVDASQRE